MKYIMFSALFLSAYILGKFLKFSINIDKFNINFFILSVTFDFFLQNTSKEISKKYIKKIKESDFNKKEKELLEKYFSSDNLFYLIKSKQDELYKEIFSDITIKFNSKKKLNEYFEKMKKNVDKKVIDKFPKVNRRDQMLRELKKIKAI